MLHVTYGDGSKDSFTRKFWEAPLFPKTHQKKGHDPDAYLFARFSPRVYTLHDHVFSLSLSWISTDCRNSLIGLILLAVNKGFHIIGRGGDSAVKLNETKAGSVSVRHMHLPSLSLSLSLSRTPLLGFFSLVLFPCRATSHIPWIYQNMHKYAAIFSVFHTIALCAMHCRVKYAHLPAL
jgi:hypothetical protein